MLEAPFPLRPFRVVRKSGRDESPGESVSHTSEEPPVGVAAGEMQNDAAHGEDHGCGDGPDRCRRMNPEMNHSTTTILPTSDSRFQKSPFLMGEAGFEPARPVRDRGF